MQTPNAAPNDPKAFLEHAAFLRRLARGLLGDPGEAEDLVQEAWMASLRARPEPGVPLRSWLAGWVRNQSLQKRRENWRRARREEAAARPDRQSPESETAERLEVLQFVLRTVEALDEPYRTVLLLRFLDDLPARAVAERLGVPVGTVRSRLRRGLAQVRTKLDAQCPGGRGALLSALAPLAGTFPQAAGAATTTWIGVTLVQSKLAFAALVAVLAGCSWFGWSRLQPAPAPLSPGLVNSTKAPDASALAGETASMSGDLTAGEQSATRQASGGEAARGAWTLQGNAYLGFTGEGFPGAPVRMRIYLGKAPGDESPAGPAASPLVEAALIADEHGALRWTGARPLETCWIDLACTAEGHTSAPARYQIAPDQPLPELNVWLHPLSFEVTGWVRDEEGAGIAGARVRRAWQETLSRDDGSFGIRLPSSGDKFYLEAYADGYAQSRQVIQPEADSTMQQVEFNLRPELVVTGRVLDVNGNPISGAGVDAFHRWGDGVRTGADGRYRLDKLDPGRPRHMLHASRDGFVLGHVDVTPGGDLLVEQDFELSRGVRVAGQVVDEDRNPVPGAELYIGFSPFAFDRIDAVCDDAGRFEFPAVGRGMQTLVAQAPGLAPSNIELEIPEEGVLVSGVILTMRKGRTIAGQVVNAEGEPVPGLSVSVTHAGDYIDRRAKTGDRGEFRLEALPEADLGVEVYGGDYLRLEQPLPGPQFEDLRLVVERAGSLAGRVIDGRTGQPMTRFRIRIVAPTLEPGDEELWGVTATWIREGLQFHRADGTWDTGAMDLRPGRVTGIEASAPGYAPSVHGRAIVHRSPSPDDCVITLYPGARLSGTVTLASTGLPLEGVRIKRFTSDHPLREYDSDDLHSRLQTQTSATGYYEFDDLPAGQMRLALLHPSFGRMVTGPIEVGDAGTPVEHNVSVATDGVIQGRLYDAAGQSLAGATIALRQVFLEGSSLDSDRRTQTGPDGHYAFDQLMSGTYEVAHEWQLFQRRTVRHFVRRVRVEQGRVSKLDLAPRGNATITVRLTYPRDLPPALHVRLTRIATLDGTELPPEDQANLGAVARNGTLRLAGLEPGLYRLWPSYWDPQLDQPAIGELTIRCESESSTEWVLELGNPE